MEQRYRQQRERGRSYTQCADFLWRKPDQPFLDEDERSAPDEREENEQGDSFVACGIDHSR